MKKRWIVLSTGGVVLTVAAAGWVALSTGNYLGYLLVKQIAKSDGLDALFHMKDTKFVPRMVEMLQEWQSAGH